MEKGREGEERERGGRREGEEEREGGREEGRGKEGGYLLYDIHPLLDHTLIQQDKLWMNYQSHH